MKKPISQRTQEEKKQTDNSYLLEKLKEREYIKQDNIDLILFEEDQEKEYLQNLFTKKNGVVYRIEEVDKKLGYVKIDQDMNLTDYILVKRNQYALRPTKKENIFEEMNAITLTEIYKKFVDKDKIYYQELGQKKGFIWSLTNDF